MVSQAVEGLFRVDLRRLDAAFIENVLRFAVGAGLRVVDEDGIDIEPALGELMLALRGSRAFRFVEDPVRYLNRLRAGGLEDA